MISLEDKNIRVLAPIKELNYFDSQEVDLPSQISALKAWNLIMEDPQPLLHLAFKIRDGISKRFGVKSIGGFSGRARDIVQVGEYLDFFLVEYSDETMLVLTERDRHLDVMTCLSIEDKKLSLTSSVVVHNLFGHAYMMPVGIAHKVIVWNMLRRLQSKLAS